MATHSFASGLNDKSVIKSSILNYMMTTGNKKYTSFMEPESIPQLRTYIENKLWCSDLVDIIPAILSNIYSVNLKVIFETGGKASIQSFNPDAKEWVAIILERAHYNYSDKEKVDPNMISWLTNQPDRAKEKEAIIVEHRKPTIVLGFKSDVWTKHILKAKNQLYCSKEFNIVFKAEARVIDIVRSQQSKHNEGNNDPDDTGVVYLAKCKVCSEVGKCSQYIGETGRALDERMKEHFRKVDNDSIDKGTSSAIGEHCLITHGTQPKKENWDVKILWRSKKTQDRRELEAKEIYIQRPSLNRDTGVHIIKPYTKF